MHDDNVRTIHPVFCAKEIIYDIKIGRVTEEQGKRALYNLLLESCGVKVKGDD